MIISDVTTLYLACMEVWQRVKRSGVKSSEFLVLQHLAAAGDRGLSFAGLIMHTGFADTTLVNYTGNLSRKELVYFTIKSGMHLWHLSQKGIELMQPRTQEGTAS